MPYVVKRGAVEHGDEDGMHVYELGEEVPGEEGELDDMVEAGSVEWIGSGEADAGVPTGPYGEMTNRELRALCKARGIKVPSGYVNVPTLLGLLAVNETAGQESGEDEDDEG